MKAIIGLILSAIAVCLGVGLIPPVVKNVSGITTANGYSSGTVGMAVILIIVFVSMIIFMILESMMQEPKENVEVVEVWEDFGERLKVAYAAKFGGDNPAFNQEVDAMILQCKTMKKGIGDTKKSAELRLKNYAHMCEIPFVIPEEEHLTEEEKTVKFKPVERYEYSDNKHQYKDNSKGTNY